MPQIPCLNVGTPRRPTYLPAEVCKLAKGQRQLKLDERQAAGMIKVAAKKPPERMAAIKAGINEKARLPTDPTLKAWQLEVSPELATVRPLSASLGHQTAVACSKHCLLQGLVQCPSPFSLAFFAPGGRAPPRGPRCPVPKVRSVRPHWLAQILEVALHRVPSTSTLLPMDAICILISQSCRHCNPGIRPTLRPALPGCSALT